MKEKFSPEVFREKIIDARQMGGVALFANSLVTGEVYIIHPDLSTEVAMIESPIPVWNPHEGFKFVGVKRRMPGSLFRRDIQCAPTEVTPSDKIVTIDISGQKHTSSKVYAINLPIEAKSVAE